MGSSSCRTQSTLPGQQLYSLPPPMGRLRKVSCQLGYEHPPSQGLLLGSTEQCSNLVNANK